MLSTRRCREALGESGRDLSDAEINALHDQLRVLAGFALTVVESRLDPEAVAREDAWERIPAEDVAEVHERAAIMEFDGGLKRDEAERRAISRYCDRRKEAGR